MNGIFRWRMRQPKNKQPGTVPSDPATESSASDELGPAKTRVRYVSGVSWPRSGHHAVANVLEAYFGSQFVYCEHYTIDDCCKSQPCSRQGVSLSKNHDFDLDTIASDDIPYLIQYRNFKDSVVSNFEVAVYNGTVSDDFESFKSFALDYANKYVRFLQKWVFDPRRPKERLVVKYEALMADPPLVMAQIVDFFAPGREIDHNLLATCIGSASIDAIKDGTLSTIEGHGLRTNRDAKDFRHYDDDFFKILNVFTWFPDP